ncbi:MAG: class I SAM-dependent methyltransferase [Bacteroidales bacterium]|nr:class I SAM-dependent methyltransferase [Bacteroidales bacterium]
MNRIDRYNKLASNPKNKASDVINALEIKTGDNILEIGVGGGFYAKIFSEKIGVSGRYYGLDTGEHFIQNLNTIKPPNKNILGIKIYPNELPELNVKIDLIFTRNVYHHLEKRTAYLRRVIDLLSPNGRIVVIDYDESLSLMKVFKHFTAKNIIIKEFKRANCFLIKEHCFLNKQLFLIFEKNSEYDFGFLSNQNQKMT